MPATLRATYVSCSAIRVNDAGRGRLQLFGAAAAGLRDATLRRKTEFLAGTASKRLTPAAQRQVE